LAAWGEHFTASVGASTAPAGFYAASRVGGPVKLLLLHSDHIEYEVTKKALRQAPELAAEARKGRMEDCLAAFITVESGDEADLDATARNAAKEIRSVAVQVGTKRVMLYPYAHLSEDLAKPSVGEKALPLIESYLLVDYEVQRSPFGWYKGFSIKVKGHPLAELSRHVGPDAPAMDSADGRSAADGDAAAGGRRGAGGGADASGSAGADRRAGAGGRAAVDAGESKALAAEKKLQSQWFILTPEGDLVAAQKFDFKGNESLRRFYEYEAKGTRTSAKEPAHIQMMQALELVDYEPGSDTGNMRWFPKGQLIKRLLEEKVNRVCRAAGGLQIETPIMYDTQHEALRKYLDKFPARQYRVLSDDKELFLRFAACFGMYLSMGRATLSYRHLPARIYELTHYSFRREQSGETSGIKRLRCFTMPDMHTLVADIEQARGEFEHQFNLSKDWMAGLHVPFETAVRFVRSFYEENKPFACRLAQSVGKPVLVEMWDQQSFYFVAKFEFNVNDTTDKAFALSTVQIDTQNPAHFGIHYAGEDGAEHTPLLLHASISGAIDRNLAAILETEAMKRDRGEKAGFPWWLAPTQVRFLPVSDDFMDEALELAGAVNDAGGRADVDDSQSGIGKKIRTAEKDWVPVIVVVGEKEKASGIYDLRVRKAETLAAAGLAEDPDEGQRLGSFKLPWAGLLQLIEANQGAEPRAPLPLPVRLTERPIFRG
jgi:threonyl-tRNA synthetase